MKKIKYLGITLLLCFSVLCLSCGEDEKIDAETLKLENFKTEIIGEWVFGSRNARLADSEGSLEFLKSNKFILAMGGAIVSDDYEVADLGTITLKGLGEIRDMTIDGNEAVFTLSTADETISVSAARTREIETDERDRLLFRKWRLLPVEDAVDSLTMVHRSYVTFSEAGSMLTENYYREDSPKPGTLMYKWRWHSTVEGRIEYWYRGEEPTYAGDYLEIRELTETSLKITYSNTYGPRQYSYRIAEEE